METTKTINQELEEARNKKEERLKKGLTTRQHRLKDWLEANFVGGKFFTIEEICAKFKDNDGTPYYHFNTNPYSHDKCIALSNDVRELNWHTGRERYIPIIKNKQGSIKLAESKEELEEYINREKAKVETKYQYYNHLNSLIALEGTFPFINQANRVLDDDELKAVEVYIK